MNSNLHTRTPRVVLKKRKRSVRERNHPWIFSGAVGSIEGEAEPGDLVHVIDGEGHFLAWGQWSPESRIRVRILDRRKRARPDCDDWWREKLESARELRRLACPADWDRACRLVFGESDGLPGLVVDRYGDYLVLQVASAGMERNRDRLVRLLDEMYAPRGIYERSDAEVRALEGLSSRCVLVAGMEPPETLIIDLSGVPHPVRIAGGQKTGAFLDQRYNRKRVAAYAAGAKMLDVFCFTGGFAREAFEGGAKSATLVDSAAGALDVARLSLEGRSAEFIRGNAFEVLRQLRNKGEEYDLIVIDPPKLAPTRAHSEKGARAYKDINLSAMKLLRPGGLLATFSCSGGLKRDSFHEIVAWAAADAGKCVQILESLSQPPDHPVDLHFPESEYLKGLIARVTSKSVAGAGGGC